MVTVERVKNKMNNKITIRTAEQTYDPDVTQIIVDILKESSPEYANCSYNLIDCLEHLSNDILLLVVELLGGSTPEEVFNFTAKLIAESIEKIHDAMAQDYDNAIERL